MYRDRTGSIRDLVLDSSEYCDFVLRCVRTHVIAGARYALQVAVPSDFEGRTVGCTSRVNTVSLALSSSSSEPLCGLHHSHDYEL